MEKTLLFGIKDMVQKFLFIICKKKVEIFILWQYDKIQMICNVFFCVWKMLVSNTELEDFLEYQQNDSDSLKIM